MSVHFKRSNFIASIFKPVVLILVREQWQIQRSIWICLDFFVTFFIKKKSKCESRGLTWKKLLHLTPAFISFLIREMFA